MTLSSALIAWVLVVALFLGWAWLAHSRQLNGAAALVLLGEAAVLTLLAGLWFSSFGHGGWVLMFLLLGSLVAGAERGTRTAFLRSAIRPELLEFGLGVARYLAAGALLAWRLG
jgi:hypothetical protein